MCVPGVTNLKTSSARVRVRSCDSGVRDIVERIKWPPGCESACLFLGDARIVMVERVRGRGRNSRLATHGE